MVIKFHRTKDTLDRIYHLIIFAECVRRVAPYPTRTPGIQIITSAIFPPLTTDSTPLSCKTPRRIRNGDFEPHKDDYLVGTTVKYSCDDNYRLRGSAKVTCTNEKSWSPKKLPRCIKSKEISLLFTAISNLTV